MRYPGHFSDGKTALRHEVRVALAHGGLEFFEESGSPVDRWPFDGLKLAGEVYKKGPIRLTHRDRGESSLTVEDREILAPLTRAAPHIRGRRFRPGGSLPRILLWVAALALLIGGLIAAVPRLAGPAARFIPRKWQEAVSVAAIQEIRGESNLCSREAGRAALNALAARLASTMDPPLRLRISVFDKSDVNAFATPAGRVLFFHGLIKQAASPEEVAGILAHEMAHVAEHHPMEGLLRAMGFRLVFGMLTGELSGTASAMGSFGQILLALSYNRDNEAEADRVGVEMLNKAGIRSDGLISFFRRLQKSGEDVPGGLSFLSTHPIHEDRISAVRSSARKGGAAMSPREWRAVREICGGNA